MTFNFITHQAVYSNILLILDSKACLFPMIKLPPQSLAERELCGARAERTDVPADHGKRLEVINHYSIALRCYGEQAVDFVPRVCKDRGLRYMNVNNNGRQLKLF